jgi:serine/threonine protein kinase
MMTQPKTYKQYDLTFEIPTMGVLQLRVKNGLPIKLGDGTFGIVYEAYNPVTNDAYAIKMLYDNYATRPKEISHLDPSHFEQVVKAMLKDLTLSNEEKATIKQVLESAPQNTASIIAAFQSAGIADWKSIIEALNKKANSTAVERFFNEMDVSKRIKRSMEKRARHGNVSGTVEIKGGTDEFHQSPAYITLKAGGFFEAQEIEVSTYALVMGLYRYTLKDLLEKGPERQLYRIKPAALAVEFGDQIPPEMSQLAPTRDELVKRIQELPESQLPVHDEPERILARKRLSDNIEELFGYGLLKLMSIDDRVRTALPYLESITIGLLKLHGVDEKTEGGPLFHLDIKPANIFVNADPADLVDFDCALGDLGFIDAFTMSEGTYAPQPDELPLGSLHYRSPEQKEYFDIANIEVKLEGERVLLVIRDPKFQGTFIEKGDTAVFSKDGNRKKYEILEKLDTGSESTVVIGIDPKKVHHGEQTQVVFYKSQRYRTDLFGVGAIAYDLITCGMSPERFYDSIRRFEYSEEPDKRGEVGDVDAVLERYGRVSRVEAEEPALLQIFAPFRHETQLRYADSDIVKLILKCMLYKARGTFYNPARPTESARELLNDIRALMKHYRVDRELYDGNPLLTLKEPPPNPIPETDAFPKIITDLQATNDAALRLAQGIFYFERLTKLVHGTTATDNAKTAYLYELLPARIELGIENSQPSLSIRRAAYTTEEEYEREVLADRLEQLVRDPTNPFVPYNLAFMRRDLELFCKQSELGNRALILTADYRFLDTSPFGDQFMRGDRIVLRTGLRRLGIVTDVDTKNLTLRVEFTQTANGQSGQPDEDWRKPGKRLKGTYYARLQPEQYYLEMLALYLHQIFFAYSSLTTESRDQIDLQEIRLQALDARTIIQPKEREGLFSKSSALKYIHSQLANMYLRLTMHDISGSYLFKFDAQNAGSWKQIMGAVVTDAEVLRKSIELRLMRDKNASRLDLALPKPPLRLVSEVVDEINTIRKEPFDIRQLMIALLSK